MDTKEKDKRRKALGRRGEDIACALLKELGCELLQRNFRAGHKELDLIFRQGNDLRFVEVKTRKLPMEGEPWEAVNFRKQRNISSAASRFIASEAFRSLGIALGEVHFDIVTVVWTEDGQDYRTEIISDAFYPIFT